MCLVGCFVAGGVVRRSARWGGIKPAITNELRVEVEHDTDLGVQGETIGDTDDKELPPELHTLALSVVKPDDE